MDYFCYKSAPKGPIPLWIFTKFGFGEGLPGSHPQTKFHCCGFKNVGLQPPKSPKLVIFGIKLAPNGYIS